MPKTVHHDITIPQTTIGLSPKLIASAITGLVGYVLTKLAVPLDPALEQALNVAAMVIAAYIAPPGAHPVQEIGTPSDDLIPPDVHKRLRSE